MMRTTRADLFVRAVAGQYGEESGGYVRARRNSQPFLHVQKPSADNGATTQFESLTDYDALTHVIGGAGSYLGAHADYAKMFAFAAEHGVKPKVEVVPLSEANTAVARCE